MGRWARGTLRTDAEIIVAFRSAKDAAFAERKATIRQRHHAMVGRCSATCSRDATPLARLSHPTVILQPRQPRYIFLPARARGRISIQESAAFGTPQLAALVAAPDEEFLDLGIGLAVAGFLTAALRAVADEDAIGKLVGRLAGLKGRPKFFEGLGRHLAQDSRTTSFSSSVGSFFTAASQKRQAFACRGFSCRNSSNASFGSSPCDDQPGLGTLAGPAASSRRAISATRRPRFLTLAMPSTSRAMSGVGPALTAGLPPHTVPPQ